MYYKSAVDFLIMSGYAKYVWPVFGMALLILILNYVIPLLRRRRLLATLRKLNDSLT